MFGGPPLARTIIPDNASPSGGNALHKMDYNMLALNHKEPSLTDLHISGLPIHVYGLQEVKDSKRPLAVMVSHDPMLLHVIEQQLIMDDRSHRMGV